MQLLCSKTGMKKVFFANSGAEANECAIKVACKYAAEKKGPECSMIVTLKNSFHGRTGKLFSYMNYGIEPDVVSTAKGIGGGLPLGCCLMGEKVESVLGYGDHGSTFGGNPVCCAGALSIIERLTDDFLAEVQSKSRYVFESLSGAPGVKSVSGMGRMIGIETEKPAGEIVKACIEKGVLCLTAKTKVRLLPALNIPMALFREAVEIIKAACAC